MLAGAIPALEEMDGMRVVRVNAWPRDSVLLQTTAAQLAFRRNDQTILIYLDQLEQLFIARHSERDMCGTFGMWTKCDG